jgi:hypothetical protein
MGTALIVTALTGIAIAGVWAFVRGACYPASRCICGHHEWQHNDDALGTPCLYCSCPRYFSSIGRKWTP